MIFAGCRDKELIPLLVFFSVFCFSSCTHNSDEVKPIPVDHCDTSSVQYTRDIAPVLKQHCYACHSGPAATAGLDLSNFGVVHDLAASPENYLLNGVNGNPDFVYMPPAPDRKLTNCEVAKIRLWCAQGAPHN